ncbi:MAG: hypothetical protein HYU66_12735 [Armatimonadetes bacterium]|nr:hypothetical protein [Armatimonadota bacterium]
MPTALLALAVLALPPIKTVDIGPHRELRVNGAPFFPLMIWLQDPGNFPHAADIGVNTVAGYWPTSGGTKDVTEYLPLVEAAGFYGVMPFEPRLKGHPALLGWIHDDEPDLSHEESAAQVTALPAMHLNPSTPLWRLVDGDTSSWTVLDPLQDAAVSIKLKEPVTATKLAIWLTVSPGLALAKQVRFSGDGKELAALALEGKRGRQEVALPQPATFRELTLTVTEVTAGQQVWGSVGEVEAFDAAGRSLLVSPPQAVPRQSPEQCQAQYQALRAADATRPVFMTLTADFMPQFSHWTAERRAELYPAYARAADVLGFDIYPLYGWGRADWVDRVYDGASQLNALAPRQPTYAWIETSKGSQWVSADKQPEVTPAHIRAEVWMSVIAGCTGIGYFTHIWKPSYSQFGVPPENVTAIRAINEQLTRLAPALLGDGLQPAPTIQLSDGLKAAVTGRSQGGSRWLFAVNCDPSAKAGEAVITVPGLAAGKKVEVVDEDRSLVSEDGALRDHFEGLAVHLYRVAE